MNRLPRKFKKAVKLEAERAFKQNARKGSKKYYAKVYFVRKYGVLTFCHRELKSDILAEIAEEFKNNQNYCYKR